MTILILELLFWKSGKSQLISGYEKYFIGKIGLHYLHAWQALLYFLVVYIELWQGEVGFEA